MSRAALLLLTACLLAPGLQAAEPPQAASAAAAAGEMTDGEVRKIDREAGRLTLRHADIKHLDMPAMTMVFQVRDRALLDKLQPGSRIQFKAAHEAGKFIVTELRLLP